MLYINKYNTEQEVKKALNNGTLLKPYLVTIGEINAKDNFDNVIDNNSKKQGYEDEYLSFEMLSAGTWTFGRQSGTYYFGIPIGNFFYRINDGEWNKIISLKEIHTEEDEMSIDSVTTIEYQEGDVIQFKGYPTEYPEDMIIEQNRPSDYVLFDMNTGGIENMTTPYNLYGNVMSIFYGDDFKDKTELPIMRYKNMDYLYTNLGRTISFNDTNVIDASGLYIPITGPGVYNQNISYPSFTSCKLLEKGPVLRLVNLKEYCYQFMFANCSSLRWVKCLAENLGPSTYGGYDYIYDWITGCPSDGVFVKKTGVEWVASRPLGNRYNSIPTGWTVEEADE